MVTKGTKKSSKTIDTDTGEILPFDPRTDFLPLTYQEVANLWGSDLTTVEAEWELIEKSELIGVPFLIHSVRSYEGKYGNEVYAIMAVTVDDRRVVFNDGSGVGGVRAQVKALIDATGRNGGFNCPKGLKSREFIYEEEDFDGNVIREIPATIYSIA